MFHCEFSAKRGPNQWGTLRKLDRTINELKYPKLFFPEMYLLEKGFSDFYVTYPELCVGGYKRQDADGALDKSRCRSLQRNLQNYNHAFKDRVTQLKKSASQDQQQLSKEPRFAKLAGCTAKPPTTGNPAKGQQEFMIKRQPAPQ